MRSPPDPFLLFFWPCPSLYRIKNNIKKTYPREYARTERGIISPRSRGSLEDKCTSHFMANRPHHDLRSITLSFLSFSPFFVENQSQKKIYWATRIFQLWFRTFVSEFRSNDFIPNSQSCLLHYFTSSFPCIRIICAKKNSQTFEHRLNQLKNNLYYSKLENF